MLDVVFKSDPTAGVLHLAARPLSAERADMAQSLLSYAKQPESRVLCLVPDCGCDLTETTHYLKRHRVCEAHMRAKTVELGGNTCRFCQQCGRFQPLTDFKGDHKSCDAALKAHNARRRQMNQDKTVLVNDRRSRGSRAKLQQDAGGAGDAGARVSRRLAARRTSTPWAAAQDAVQQQRRPAGAARKETRSDGSDTAYAGNSRSPSASMQSWEDPDSQRYTPEQQQQQYALEFPPNYSGTTSPSGSSRQSRGEGCTAAHGSAQSAQRALSGSSGDSGVHVQLQPSGFVLDGSTTAKSAAGCSRLGLVASGSSGAPPQPAGDLLSEQLLLAASGTSPALCAGMESSPTGSCAGQQQGSLADWMAQHNPDDVEQQLQQLWTAAAAAGQPCPAGPTSTAFDCVAAAGDSHLMLSQGSTQQQAGWPPVAGQAGQINLAADAWGAPQQQLVQGHVMHQQQQQLSLPQQQEQCWVSMLLDTDIEPATTPPAPATSGNNDGSSPAGASLHAPTETGPSPTPGNGLWQSASSGAAPADQIATAAADGCPGVSLGAPSKLETDPLDPLDPLDSSLEDALDLLDVMLAEVPEWQLLQPSSVATTNEAGTSGTRTSSSPGSSNGQLPNPTGRLSDISWADFAGADLGAAACAEGTAPDQGCDILQVPAPAGAPDTTVAAAGGVAVGRTLVQEGTAKPGVVPAAVPVGAVGPDPAAVAGTACAMFAGASIAACGPQAALGLVPGTSMQAYAGMAGVAGMAVATQPFMAGPSLQPAALAGVPAAPDAAFLPTPCFNPAATAGQLGAAALCVQQATEATGLPSNSLGWAQGPVCQPAGVAAAAPAAAAPAAAAPAAAAAFGMPPSTTWEQTLQPSQPVSAEPSLALLQQEQLLAQQQLQQQQMLQQMHWQQRQQLLQQHNQLKHYLVRLSVKLHGVMPEQLPSHTVQAMERLVLENAGLMEAIMLQPSFRQGCVQMEFDLLVKPHGPMPAHHAADQPVQEQQGGTAGNSNNKRMQAAGEWSAVVAASSSCPATAAAEAQLRQALPFSLLLDTLLALPLLPSSRAGSAVSETDLDCDLDSTSDGDSSAGLPYDSDSDADSEQALGRASLASLTTSERSARTAGSAVRAVYAQIGDSVGIWTATQGLVQDWTPVAATAVSGAEQEHSPAATVPAGGGAGLRPAFITAGPLCTAPTAGHHLMQLSSLSPVLLQAVVLPGSSASSAGLADSDSQHSSETVKLWCTAGGEFVPLATRPAHDSAAAEASAAGGFDTGATKEVLLGLQTQHMPGLLLLQAEQLHGSCRENGGKVQHSGQMLVGDDPLTVKSAVVPVVVCPSVKVAAEVRSVLLGAVGPRDAASLLQQLGLLLDCQRMLQQQQEGGGRKTDRQQWASGLLSNPSYLEVIRSACLFWLMFAGIHEMPATASSLLSICCSLHSSLAAVHAADNASPAGNEPEDASAAAVAEEPAATQESPDAPAAAAGGAAAATPSGLEPAAALVQRTPAQQWVFEDDVGCGTSSSKRSDAEGTQEVSTQTPPGVHIKEGCTVMRSGVSRLLSAFSVLAVLLAMMLVARLTGWLPHALNLLHAMWVPLVVLTAGCILGLIVLWQQPGSAGEGGEYDLLADETEPFSKHGSAGAMYAVPVGEGEGQAGLVEK